MYEEFLDSFSDLFILMILLLSNAFFVISEFAFISVKKAKILQLAKEGNKSAQIINNFMMNPDRFIASIQLGVTLSSIGMGWVGEATLADILESLFTFIPGIGRTLVVHGIASIISFTLVTVFLVSLGELVPKSLALHYSEKIALTIARPISFITTIFTPGIFILNTFANFVLKAFKVPSSYESQLSHSIEELNILINASYKEGVLNYIEKDILQNVFKMSDLMAKQVMIPRPDMICIPSKISEEEIKALIYEHQYTRYPVFENDLDHIVGMVHIKDVYPLFYSSEKFNLSKVIRKALLIPETMTIDNLLVELKKKRLQMAIVVDEFGGTSGIITIEDILEEIFGQVQDEFDFEEPEINKISDNEFLINAMLRIDEINELFNLEISDEDVETIGGYVIKMLGRIAEVEDQIQIENYLFIVDTIDGPRITKLKVHKISEPDINQNEQEE